ncbi:hypothetical protein [Georgenia deserti]|uniref:MFS transporter n=1 Tax=Georgenia deserti TaxID=2093781 RepID=A0ABW4L0A2_9MICO
MMVVAPGRTEMALAANSAVFNVGIALGAAGGGLVRDVATVRTTFLAGSLATLVASAAAVFVMSSARYRPNA